MEDLVKPIETCRTKDIDFKRDCLSNTHEEESCSLPCLSKKRAMVSFVPLYINSFRSTHKHLELGNKNTFNLQLLVIMLK